MAAAFGNLPEHVGNTGQIHEDAEPQQWCLVEVQNTAAPERPRTARQYVEEESTSLFDDQPTAQHAHLAAERVFACAFGHELNRHDLALR